MEISCGIWVRGQSARESRFISRFFPLLPRFKKKKLSAERCFVVFISCSLSTLLKMWLRLSGSSAGWKRILRLMSALIGLSNVSSMDWLPSRRRHFWGIPADEFQNGEKKKKEEEEEEKGARFAERSCCWKIVQWKDALFLRGRVVQAGFTPSGIQTSSYMLHMLSLSLSLFLSLSLSLSLSPSANLRTVTLRKRLDLVLASSSYLTHPPGFTHATESAFSLYPAVVLEVCLAPAGGFLSPVNLRDLTPVGWFFFFPPRENYAPCLDRWGGWRAQEYFVRGLSLQKKEKRNNNNI